MNLTKRVPLALTVMLLLLAGSHSALAATAPTINANNQIAECRNPTVSVWINAKLSSATDPLPFATYTDRVSGDPNAYPSNMDPDNYPLGLRNVTIKGCDHASPANCNTKVVTVNVRDTLSPSINLGTNRTYQCSSPNGLAGSTVYCEDSCLAACQTQPACTNPNTLSSGSCTTCQSNCVNACTNNPNAVHLNKPVITDICDPNVVYNLGTLPTQYPLGTTSLSAYASDHSGNNTSNTVSVTIQDTNAPIFNATVPSWNVTSTSGNSNTCLVGGNPGTQVTLPQPSATDLCTTGGNISYSWSFGGKTVQSPSLCLPNNTSAVTFTATDGSGNAVTTQGNVTILNTFPLTINVSSASTGYVKQGTLSASATGGTNPVKWTAVGSNAPDGGAIAPGTNISLTYSTPGNYCPLYLSAVDSNATPRPGAATPLCFAVDGNAPTQTYQSVMQGNFPTGTVPVYNHGSLLNMGIAAADQIGTIQSGVARVQATIISPSGNSNLVYDNTYCTNSSSSLVSCPATHYVGGCNQVAAGSPCTCTNKDSVTGECTTDGRLSLASMPTGVAKMRVVVTDLAGNASSQDYNFIIADLPSALVGFSGNGNVNAITGLIQQVYNNSATPAGAKPYLKAAQNYATGAASVFLESPGQALMLVRQAWTQLDSALAAGANVSYLETLLANLATGEVNQIYNAYLTNFKTPGQLLASTWSFIDVPSREIYKTRSFIYAINGQARDYVTVPASTLTLSSDLLALANQYVTLSQTSAAIDAAVQAHDALSTLFSDTILSGVYNYAVHQDPCYNVPEAYYKRSDPAHFGAEIASTMSLEISRFTSLAAGGGVYGISPTNLTVLQTVNTAMQSFSSAVAVVQGTNWNPNTSAGFSNKLLVQSIYLNAVTALQNLQTLQASNIYTRYWQTAIDYTLAQVVNFSEYVGPTALTCILWGQNGGVFDGCAQYAAVGAPLIYASNGSTAGSSTIDYQAQTAECRYSKMLYALADGRLTQNGNVAGASDLFVQSKCVIIDLYNRYYGTAKYLAADTCIDPSLYGCPNTPATGGKCATVTGTAYTLASTVAECGTCTLGGSKVTDSTCNGVDDDCNGLVDDKVAVTSCGCTGLDLTHYTCPCSATSACVNGQQLPCVPGPPVATIDTTCSTVDVACTGHPGSNWQSTTCGVGGCMAQSSCSNGTLSSCSPTAPAQEVCNGLDDDCNIVKDDFLDADQDSYGCTPCQLYTTSSTCGTQVDCTWNTSTSRCTNNDNVVCNQCIPGQNGCGTTYLCSADQNSSGWTGVWDCDDTDATVYPGGIEVCDGKDNNCNGQIDEGVLNSCGTCSPKCTTTTVGQGGTPFDPTPTNSSNIGTDPNGNVNLTSQNLNLQFAWVSNDTAGTISKIDMTTGSEVARYCQAIKTGVATFVNSSHTDPTGAAYDTRAVPGVCAGCGGCNNGSRTAVTLAGDMLIANRAYSDSGYLGTYTKVSGNVHTCVDVNGDGNIQTSTDVNGDGVINQDMTLPVAKREYWGELDECILWTRQPTTWDQAAQPACNNANMVLNTEPIDTAWYDDQTTCANAFPTDPNICQFAITCAGSGNPACASQKTSTACGLQAYCTWKSNACTANACPTVTLGGSTTATTQKSQCSSHPGCTFTERCYNIGAGPFFDVGVSMAMPRALALDKNGDAWIGLFNRRGFMQVNPQNGNVKRWVYTGYQPYGSSLDRNGILWHGDSCCGSSWLAGMNTSPNTVVYTNPNTNAATFTWPPYGTNASKTVSPGGSYGVATDNRGYVYIGSYPQYTSAGFRFDAYRNTWTAIASTKNAKGQYNNAVGVGRGTAVGPDGTIWIAQMGYPGITNPTSPYTGGRLTGYSPDTLTATVDVDFGQNGTTPIGVGIGYQNRVWTSNQTSYNVSVVDPTTSAVSYFPVGGPPYCYSDFTGAVLRTFTSPTGNYDEIINACYGFPVDQWVNLTWQAQLPIGTQNSGKAPSASGIKFRMRGAASLVTQDSSGNPVDPGQSSAWSLWFPDDVTDPSKNPADTSRQYYWQINLPDVSSSLSTTTATFPTTGVCGNRDTATYSATPSPTYNLNGCADLTGVPTSYVFNAATGSQAIAYVQVEAALVSDVDNVVVPTLINFQVSRNCPQL